MEKCISKIKIVWYNSKILFDINIIIALIIAVLIPVFFSFKFITYKEMVIISEIYIPIIGVILFPYTAVIEKNYALEEIIYPRKVRHRSIFILRFVITMLFTLAIIFCLCNIAIVEGAVFPIVKVILGSFITAIFLGTLGFTISNVMCNLASGYLISFAYYFFEYNTLGKYTKDFYIFSLLKNDFKPKGNLLILIASMFIINVVFIELRNKNIDK